MARGDTTQAIKVLLTLAERWTNDWLSRAQLAEVYQSLERYEVALKWIQEAFSIAPSQLKLQAKLALIAQHAGHIALARTHYQEVINGDVAAFGQFRLNLANCCYALGDFAAAVQHYQQHLFVQPDHQACRNNLAMALEREFQFDQAAAQWRQLIDRDPDNPQWWALLGALELRRENLNEAEHALTRAATLGANDEVYWVNRASLLFEQRRFEESLALLDQQPALSGRPDIEQLRFLNRYQAGQYQQCIAQIQGAIAAGHRSTAMVALSLLPQAYLEAGDPAAATAANNFDGLIKRSAMTMDEQSSAALIQHIIQHPSLTFEPVTTSTHNGSQTQSLLIPDHPKVQDLLTRIRQQVLDYVAHLALSSSAYASLIPDRGRIKMWAVALSSGGYQGAHMHPHGIISGVYYLSVPKCEDSQQGALELGCPEPKFDRTVAPQVSLQPVKSGDLLIFPSWSFHRTLPFSSEDQRISVAFDVVPPDSPEWNDPGLSPPFSLAVS